MTAGKWMNLRGYRNQRLFPLNPQGRRFRRMRMRVLKKHCQQVERGEA